MTYTSTTVYVGLLLIIKFKQINRNPQKFFIKKGFRQIERKNDIHTELKGAFYANAR